MMGSYLRAADVEWRKTRGTSAAWLVVIGAFFSPAIIIAARLIRHETLARIYAAPWFWYDLWRSAWESMAIFLLPLGTILAASLVAQIEVRNNGWKQLHAQPLPLGAIYAAKLTVVAGLLVAFFALFNIGIVLAGLIPWAVVSGVPFPPPPRSLADFAWQDLYYMIDLLPIVALQFLLSMHYRNYLISLGAGFLLWIGALSILRWEYGYVLPYTYLIVGYLKNAPGPRGPAWPVDLHLLSVVSAAFFLAAGAALYLFRRDRS